MTVRLTFARSADAMSAVAIRADAIRAMRGVAADSKNVAAARERL